MKIKFSRAVLGQAIGECMGFTSKTKEILKCCLVSCSGADAVVSANDGENFIQVEVAYLESSGSGAFLVNNQMFDIFKEARGDEVEIVVTSSGAEVFCGGNKWTILSEKPEEFPDCPSIAAGDEGTFAFTVPGGVLQKAIGHVVFACDVNSHRYALGGVELSGGASRCAVAASDSRRLAYSEFTPQDWNSPSREDLPESLVIPQRSAKRVSAYENDGEVEVVASRVLVKFSTATRSIYCRTVEGRFPNWRDLIASFSGRDESVYQIATGPFLSTVRQARIVQNKESRGCEFSIKDGTLVVCSTGSDVGSSRIELPVQGEGDSAFCADGEYVQQFLNACDNASTVEMAVGDASSPITFECEGANYILMGMAND